MSLRLYGAGSLIPSWTQHDGPHSPILNYKFAKTYETLAALATESNGSPYYGVTVEFTWHFHEHIADEESVLFSYTDSPVLQALSLYREEAMAPPYQEVTSSSPSSRRPRVGANLRFRADIGDVSRACT